MYCFFNKSTRYWRRLSGRFDWLPVSHNGGSVFDGGLEGGFGLGEPGFDFRFGFDGSRREGHAEGFRLGFLDGGGERLPAAGRDGIGLGSPTRRVAGAQGRCRRRCN